MKTVYQINPFLYKLFSVKVCTTATEQQTRTTILTEESMDLLIIVQIHFGIWARWGSGCVWSQSCQDQAPFRSPLRVWEDTNRCEMGPHGGYLGLLCGKATYLIQTSWTPWCRIWSSRRKNGHHHIFIRSATLVSKSILCGLWTIDIPSRGRCEGPHLS